MAKPQPVPSSLMGPLERFLLSAPDAAVGHLLMTMEVWEIQVLEKLNTRLRYWFYGYGRRTWDFETFLKLYVPRPATLLSLIDGKHAMIYGGAVLRFFLRFGSKKCPLDICTTLAKYYQLNRVLRDDGFRLTHPRTRKTSTSHDLVGDLLRRVGVTHNTWSLAADKSWAAEDHVGYLFQYRKRCRGEYITVNLHLVRCEPYRHVLGGPITPLTCYMTNFEAGAPFARSTFRLSLAFALRNFHLLDIRLGRPYSVESHFRTVSFEIVKGPPNARKTYFTAETGSRRLGDGFTWTIPRKGHDPMLPPAPRQGPAFEALDWNMVCDDLGTYMSIGEPFVWRYYFANRAEIQMDDDSSSDV
ncbi:hypothetical protein DFP72DRAFT_1074901 [Ephemerocybe angulata]|uniref:Uncharacterized protein n=1 Tax=Ephemerocybe angulata TaxID=980116 RepID=A0A8H6LYR0_9AGAR|nr:hypothetical protein DFP72DRAFT_1074901 [Tulosesus angulatus]